MQTTVEPSVTTRATPMQESVWWAHQRAKNQTIYNVTWRLGCDRAVSFDALALAWQQMVDRHEALRTCVARVGADIELTVLPQIAVELGRVEVDDPGTADVDTLLRLIAEEAHARVMALESAPLGHLTLVRVADRQEILLTVHHVVLDGWALQLLVGELSTAYRAARDGRRASFDDDPPPFHAYADEVRLAGAQGRWQPSLEYWCKTLEGAAAATVVADRHAEAAVGATGRIVRYAFSDEAVAGVAALARATFATPFAIVLGAMQIVLARGGAGPDVTVGVVVANRITPRDQGLVGYTANLCIARATVDDSASIADVVAGARDGVWGMLAHQSVPYPAVFRALSGQTQATLSDASPMMLSYLGPIGSGLRLDDVELTFLRSPNRAARADMAMAFWDVEDGHLAEIEFNTARYDEDTVIRLLRDIDAVLAAGGADSSREVGSLEVSSRCVSRRETQGRGLGRHAGAFMGGPRSASLATPEGAPGSHAATPADPPSSDAWDRVAAAWAEVVGSPPGDPGVDFFAAGGNSLSLVRLAAALEADTGVTIDIVDWLSEPTPRRILAQLNGDGDGDGDDGAGAPTTLTWVRAGSGPHLHLVPGAGGSVADFRDLIAALPPHWRVTASQEREPLATVPAMGQRYRADLEAAALHPDILAGWSIGGQIAYEMDVACDGPAPALVVLDSTPPVGIEIDTDLQDRWAFTFATSICRSLGLQPDCSPPRTRGDDVLRMGALAAYLACAGQQISAAVLAERWQAYLRHVKASASHRQSARVDAPALIVGADLLNSQLDQWEERVGQRPRRLRVDADHHGMLLGEHAEQIAAGIVALEPAIAERS